MRADWRLFLGGACFLFVAFVGVEIFDQNMYARAILTGLAALTSILSYFAGVARRRKVGEVIEETITIQVEDEVVKVIDHLHRNEAELYSEWQNDGQRWL